MRHRLPAFVLCIFALLCMGCATRAFRAEERGALTEALYRKGSLLVSLDRDASQAFLSAQGLPEEAVGRVGRIVAVLSDDQYPLDKESAAFTALVEGSFPKTLTGLALAHSEGWSKVPGGGWSDGKVSAGVLSGGLLLVTKGSYEAEKERLAKAPENPLDVRIPDFSSVPIGIYAETPSTFFPVSDDLPKTVLDGINRLTAEISGTSVSARLEMASEDKASALGKVIRSWYVRELRLRHEKLDFTQLRSMFTQEGNLLTMDGMQLPDAAFLTAR